ncbi:MAG: preprotein translocase subunit SecE [Phycisphaerales bacterium]|nr:preprotein translocase subunit SecE [Phycisphaerales bacterium]
MALGIYKPGQGYWVRVLTAIGAGILVLMTASYGWQQASGFSLPTPTWTMAVTSRSGELQREDLVDLYDRRGTNIGAARVVSLETTGAGDILILGDIAMDRDGDALHAPSEAERVESQTTSARVAVENPRGVPIFELLYLQAAIAGGILLFGSIIIYWFVGSRRSTVEFLVATDAEMKKVHWSTRKEIIGSTQVVVVATFLIAFLLFVIDAAFSSFFSLVNVLEN